MVKATLEGARPGIPEEQRGAWIEQNRKLDDAGIPGLLIFLAQQLKQTGYKAAVVRVSPRAMGVTPTVGLLFRNPNESGEVDESNPEAGKKYKGVFVTPGQTGLGLYTMGSNGGLWYVRRDEVEEDNSIFSFVTRIESAMKQSEESAVYGSVGSFKWEEVLSETGPDIYSYERIDKA